VAAELFVDTSAWYPLARTAHPDHARAVTALKERVAAGVRIVTTNLILAETHALLLSRAGPDTALAFLREIRTPPNEVVDSGAELEQRAVAWWLERYRDQLFSLADAVSFQVMRERRIREALTLDHHFAVAGFAILPR
jgi:predicted nucleic acid-binding protein